MREHEVAPMLGAHLALSGPTPEVWRRVACGELSPDDAAARLLDGTNPTEAEREAIASAMVIFAPPTNTREQACLDALLARRAAEGGGSVHERPAGTRRARDLTVGALAIAAAAALALWVADGTVPPDEPLAFLGDYQIELDNPSAQTRGTAPRPRIPRYFVDGKLTPRLVPERAVDRKSVV